MQIIDGAYASPSFTAWRPLTPGRQQPGRRRAPRTHTRRPSVLDACLALLATLVSYCSRRAMAVVTSPAWLCAAALLWLFLGVWMLQVGGWVNPERSEP